MRSSNHKHLLDVFTACRGGDLDFVRHVFDEYPEEISLINESGMTCLHMACSYNHIAIVEYLLSLYTRLRLDATIGDQENGWNAFHHAMYYCNFAICKILH